MVRERDEGRPQEQVKQPGGREDKFSWDDTEGIVIGDQAYEDFVSAGQAEQKDLQPAADRQNWIAKLKAHGGELVLGSSLKWRMTKPMPDYVVAQVLHECRMYDYSPADGYPGVRMAHIAAKSVGGTVEVNELPKLPEGAIP